MTNAINYALLDMESDADLDIILSQYGTPEWIAEAVWGERPYLRVSLSRLFRPSLLGHRTEGTCRAIVDAAVRACKECTCSTVWHQWAGRWLGGVADATSAEDLYRAVCHATTRAETLTTQAAESWMHHEYGRCLEDVVQVARLLPRLYRDQLEADICAAISRAMGPRKAS